MGTIILKKNCSSGFCSNIETDVDCKVKYLFLIETPKHELYLCLQQHPVTGFAVAADEEFHSVQVQCDILLISCPLRSLRQPSEGSG